MGETGLLEEYTIDSLLLEPEKIKKTNLEDGIMITNEPTRQHKDVLNRLKLYA